MMRATEPAYGLSASLASEHPPDDELQALREQNKRLQDLVVRLSKLVIRKVVDEK